MRYKGKIMTALDLYKKYKTLVNTCYNTSAIQYSNPEEIQLNILHIFNKLEDKQVLYIIHELDYIKVMQEFYSPDKFCLGYKESGSISETQLTNTYKGLLVDEERLLTELSKINIGETNEKSSEYYDCTDHWNCRNCRWEL